MLPHLDIIDVCFLYSITLAYVSIVPIPNKLVIPIILTACSYIIRPVPLLLLL
jgi:hypothetical protein